VYLKTIVKFRVGEGEEWREGERDWEIEWNWWSEIAFFYITSYMQNIHIRDIFYC